MLEELIEVCVRFVKLISAKMVKFTKRQWLTLIVISIADFCNAICVSLQAPFYPQEVSILYIKVT